MYCKKLSSFSANLYANQTTLIPCLPYIVLCYLLMIVECDSTHAVHFGPVLGTDNSTWLLKI